MVGKYEGMTGRAAALATPTDLQTSGVRKIADALNKIVADSFVLYVKTKNFHWHVTGPHFPDYHGMFDAQAGQILDGIDPLAERVRKLGGVTLHSLKQIDSLRTLKDSDKLVVSAAEMLAELESDNRAVVEAMRDAYATSERENDVPTANLLADLIDGAEKRVWFLFSARQG